VAALSDGKAVALVLAIAFVFAIPGLLVRADPNSDGLFYEAQAAELEGKSHDAAFNETFNGPRAREAARIEDPPGTVRILDPRWDKFSAQFYERRWLVPALADAVSKVSGESIPRALQTVSMFGYMLLGPVLFLLLRRRFDVWPSLLTALGCLLLPPLYRWSFGQFVDSWGVLLETVGLLALILIAEKGLRWLWLWIAAMALLSITRDATMILGIAAVILLIAQRRSKEATRRNLIVVATGAIVAAPALLLGGAPVKDNLAYILDGFTVPPKAHETWNYVIHGYPRELWFTIKENLHYPMKAGFAAPVAYVGLAFLVFVGVLVLLKRTNRDVFWIVIKASIPGCVLLLFVANNPQGFRLELVFLPVIAAGIALVLKGVADYGVRWWQSSGSRRWSGTTAHAASG
jgi:dolichyl-phosphate-mannose-protein mannosyltransferase